MLIYQSSKIQLLLYVSITFVLTLFLTISNNLYANALAQAVPALTTLLLILTFKMKKDELCKLGIFKIGDFKWYVIAITLPFFAIVFSYLIAEQFQFVTFIPWNKMLHFTSGVLWFFELFYKYIITAFLWPLLWAAGEEIGWRGYLQPKLTEIYGLKYALLLTGIIWALWHYIFIYYGGYYETGNIIMNTLLFTITIVFMAFSIGYIRYASQSIWPAVLFHSASNAAWQMWSYQFKIISPNFIYIAGEAGVANILFWGVFLCFIRNKINISQKA